MNILSLSLVSPKCYVNVNEHVIVATVWPELHVSFQ